jgi:hypothetical protein
MRKYKVTGKFNILNEMGDLIKEDIFINKIVEDINHRSAMESVIKIMTEKISLKYKMKIKLHQISMVSVKRI